MPGTFTFRPIEANLTHDADWLGKMDPYCAFMINNQRIKGQVCKSGGQHPIWNDKVVVPLEVDAPACVVELMDKEKLLPDDSIGTFVIDLKEVQNKGSVNRWFPVYHKNKPAGEILLEVDFQPGLGTAMNQGFLPMSQQHQTYYQEKIAMGTPLYTQSQGYSGSQQFGGLQHTSSLEDPLYGKTVGVQPISHQSGIPLESQYGYSKLQGQGFSSGQQGFSSSQQGLISGQQGFSQGQGLSSGQQGFITGQQGLTQGLGQQGLGQQGYTQGVNPGSYVGGFSQTNKLNQGNQPGYY